MVVITIRQKATSSADVSARFTKVSANEKTMSVTAKVAAEPSSTDRLSCPWHQATFADACDSAKSQPRRLSSPPTTS